MPFDGDIEITVEDVTRHYSSMQDNVDLINGYVAGSFDGMTILPTASKKDDVKRNVEHLEIMLSKEYWTDEDMTAVHAAIAAGKEYLKA